MKCRLSIKHTGSVPSLPSLPISTQILVKCYQAINQLESTSQKKIYLHYQVVDCYRLHKNIFVGTPIFQNFLCQYLVPRVQCLTKIIELLYIYLCSLVICTFLSRQIECQISSKHAEVFQSYCEGCVWCNMEKVFCLSQYTTTCIVSLAILPHSLHLKVHACQVWELPTKQ